MRGAGSKDKGVWSGSFARLESCVFMFSCFAQFWTDNETRGGPSKTRLRIILRDQAREGVSYAGPGRFPSRLSGLGNTHAWFRRLDASTLLRDH
jgi:hypothetical protein